MSIEVPAERLIINVQKAKYFNNEQNHEKEGLHVYKTTSKNRGVIKIINVKHVVNCDTRVGSEIDVENLHELFSQMGGFTIDIEQNTRSKNDIIRALNSTCRNTKTNRPDMLIVFIMSHGNNESSQDYFNAENGDKIFYRDVRELFNNANCTGMENKPKLLFFQTCRGQNENRGAGSVSVARYDGNVASNSIMPVTSDLIIAYATNPDMVALRWEHIGSLFIHYLCKEFMTWARTRDVSTMLDSVYRKMTYLEARNKYNQAVIQSGEYLKVVFDKCYLNPGIYLNDRDEICRYSDHKAKTYQSTDSQSSDYTSEAALQPEVFNSYPKIVNHFYSACFEGVKKRVIELLPLLDRTETARRPESGWTALHGAARGNHWQICNILLSSKLGLDVNDPDKKGMTALHHAAREGHFKTVELLVNYGANPNLPTKKGKNAFDVASCINIKCFLSRIMKS